jgi:hypothetical protein
MQEQLSDQISPRRFQTWLLGSLSVVAMMLAAIGVLGVMLRIEFGRVRQML